MASGDGTGSAISKSTEPRTLRSLEDLRAAPYNPRTIEPSAAKGLAASLEAFGDLSGIVWNARTGHLVAGHQRVDQLRKLGAVLEVGDDGAGLAHGDRWWPIRIVEWDDATEKAANVTANNPKIAGEFTEAIGPLLADVALSFPPDDFAALRFDDLALDFGGKPGRVADDDAPDPPRKTVVRTGDLWTLGSHRVLCGDSTKPEDVARVIDGATIAAVVADAPYGIRYSGKGRRGRARANDFGPIAGDDGTQAARKAFSLLRSMIPDAANVWWGANYFCDALPASCAWLVWDKEVVGDAYSAAELAWTNRTGRTRMFRHQWHGMIKASESGEARVHPTQKPVALAEWIFAELEIGPVVLDPFAGSGSTLIAVEKLARRCFAIELMPVFVEVIVRRWERFTGRVATLESGETLDDLAKTREAL